MCVEKRCARKRTAGYWLYSPKMFLAGDRRFPVDHVLSLMEAGAGQAAAEKAGIGKVLLRAQVERFWWRLYD